MITRVEFGIAALAIASTWTAHAIRIVAYEDPKQFQGGTLLPTFLELQTFSAELHALIRGY